MSEKKSSVVWWKTMEEKGLKVNIKTELMLLIEGDQESDIDV